MVSTSTPPERNVILSEAPGTGLPALWDISRRAVEEPPKASRENQRAFQGEGELVAKRPKKI
jgi:hypothetical protein